MGWAGKTNGELLRLAKEKFDVFVTVDQNLQYQQNLRQSKIAVISLVVKSNCFETIKPLVSKVQQSLDDIQTGQYVRIK